MQWNLPRICLVTTLLTAFTVTGTILLQRTRVGRGATSLDILCYAGGSLLFWFALVVPVIISWVYSLDGSLAVDFLGWPETIPLSVWLLTGTLGAVIFCGRWRYRRHKSKTA
jgi:hypothetical protein